MEIGPIAFQMPLALMWYLYSCPFHLMQAVGRKHLFRTPNSSHITLCRAAEIHTPPPADVQCSWCPCERQMPHRSAFGSAILLMNIIECFYRFILLIEQLLFCKNIEKRKVKVAGQNCSISCSMHILCSFSFFSSFFFFFLNIWRNISVSQLYRGQVPKIWMQYCRNLYCTIVISQTNCL